MPYYTKEGKQTIPMDDKDFLKGMKNGYFVKRKHKAFVALLYYTACRVSEVLRAKKEQFKVTDSEIIWNVGKRLKHGLETPPLNIPLLAPYAEDIAYTIRYTRKGERVFPYSRVTGWLIVRRVFKYPHFFRLSRITNFFLEGWTIAQVRSWTGLSLRALEYYVGLVDVKRMGESLK